MLRVILVIDDYNELIYLQTLLKKLGFDVEGLQSTKKYADVSLGFNPQVLITTALGKKVDGLSLAQNITRRRGLPKVFALRPRGIVLTEEALVQAGIDVVLDSPVQPKALIAALAQHAGADEESLLEKYDKIQGALEGMEGHEHMTLSFDENGQPIEKSEKVRSTIEALTGIATTAGSASGGESDSEQLFSDLKVELPKAPDPARQARFAKKMAEVGKLPVSFFDRDLIRDFNKKIRAWEKPDDIEEVEDERKKFVKALFKKEE